MKIGIDISQVVYQGSGVARFTNDLIRAIVEYDDKNQWFFFFSSLRRNLDQKLIKIIKSKDYQLKVYKYPPSLLSFLWNDLHDLSSKFLSYNFSLTSLDWFITSDWTEPLIKNVNKTTIVHDLVYLRHPETVAKNIIRNQEKRLFWVKKESKVIFTDSFATKQDMIQFLNIDPQRIVVNYPGTKIEKPTERQISNTLKKYKINNQFILNVGKIEPRKNLKRLIEAFNRLNLPTIDLVIVGPTGWEENFDESINRSLNGRIKFLGFVDEKDLSSLYSSCLFFVYPSIWEGFGYPVAEAMRLGIPVITSNTSSLKEIAKDAAFLVNPFNTDEIINALKTMLTDKRLREELTKRGKQRSQIFSWRNYYDRMIKTLVSSK